VACGAASPAAHDPPSGLSLLVPTTDAGLPIPRSGPLSRNRGSQRRSSARRMRPAGVFSKVPQSVIAVGMPPAFRAQRAARFAARACPRRDPTDCRLAHRVPSPKILDFHRRRKGFLLDPGSGAAREQVPARVRRDYNPLTIATSSSLTISPTSSTSPKFMAL
jgi:hypothetical protein